MALRGRKPVLKENRLKALIYGNKGTGKTHFACSIPNVYYIDTEGTGKYEKFIEMLKKNNGDISETYDLQDIILEVKELLSTKHNFKTLVIDSISMPCGHLANLEVERLVKKSPNTEGTEFGANLAKVKRLTFHLGILLSRLDMNVIVSAHEKPKFEKGIEIGKDADVNEKIGYCLGSVWNLRLNGPENRKLYVEKTRYDELKTGELLDFNNGYEVLKEKFGEETFVRDSIPEKLASIDEIIETKRLIEVMRVQDDIIQKWFSRLQITCFDEMKSEDIQKCIKHYQSQVRGV